MGKNYTEELIILMNKIQSDEIGSKIIEGDLQIKSFFGGGAVYARNHIFMTLTKVGLGLKLSDADLNKIMKIGGKELRYFPKGHIKKQYSIIPEKIIQSSKDFSEWINKSIDFVLLNS